MRYPPNKTKIVCTIGPASDSIEVMEALLRAGMNVARLNFSHGDFETHTAVVEKLRTAAKNTHKQLTIMADLPGPKMRIGHLPEPIHLETGDRLILTTEDVMGDQQRVSVSFKELPKTVKQGDKLFLNDGLISLQVTQIEAQDVDCEVRVGGELSSRKGLNLPGIDLGFSAFTEHDRACLEQAANLGLDAVSQSFVANKEDILDLKKAANELNYQPFIIAKIERSGALDNLVDILQVSDGLMVARGDLGVEIPISSMAVIQKKIMHMANQYAKPVITATQMLESMTKHRRPTRAEATDVANAILDGTDAVMLSGESAVGLYPVEAAAMLVEIASQTEPHRKTDHSLERLGDKQNIAELIAHNLQMAVKTIHPEAVIIPTRSGSTARHVTRYRLPVWITAFSTQKTTYQTLQFSYGVFPLLVEKDLGEWTPFLREWFKEHQISEGVAVLAQGPSPQYPCGNHRVEFMDLSL